MAKRYLFIPYSDKEEAKQLGARWDKKAQSWFIPDGLDEVMFSKWIDNRDPCIRFTDDLIAHGCLLRPGEPVCDGQTHRVQVEGDKGNVKSGFYVMHLDGVPNGYFMNNRTKDSFKNMYFNRGIEEREDPAVIKQRQEEIKKQQEAAEVEKKKKEQQIAIGLWKQMKHLRNTDSVTSPYFRKKRIPGSFFTFVSDDDSNLVTWIPLYDINKQLTTVQTISPEGEKRFVKGGKKSGSFHVVLGKIEPKDSTIIICEGYATAASIQYCLSAYNDVKVVAAIDAGNLLPVAVSLKNRYPNMRYLIAGDNDHLSDVNVGVQEATRAAEAIGAMVVIPKFADDDTGSDFNDLMISSGREVVVKSFVQALLV